MFPEQTLRGASRICTWAVVADGMFETSQIGFYLLDMFLGTDMPT